MKVLVLDDKDLRHNLFRECFAERDFESDHAYTAEECWGLIKEKKYDMIFLDHDLGFEEMVSSDREDTGSGVARKMSREDHQNQDTPVVVHSFNQVGAKYMCDLIKNATYIPGVFLKEEFDKYIVGA